jgi:putative intracellular protease/amidase
MTAPYYRFTEHGLSVDIASIDGGEVPIDPISFKWYIISEDDQRYLHDAEFQQKAKHSIAIADVNISDYDIVFLAGGWGAGALHMTWVTRRYSVKKSLKLTPPQHPLAQCATAPLAC